MLKQRTERVVFQPVTCRGMQRGINQIADAVRPTLGPLPRVVAIQRILDERMPEVLDNGGTIAKRIIQLPDRDEDMGAMFLRDVLWRLQDQVGDGTATAAVLFQAAYNEGVRYLAAGGNAMRLRTHLEAGMRLILDQLAEMSDQVEGKDKLAEVAESICYDSEMAKLLGEIFDIIGEYGRLEIRKGRSRGLEREYVEGMYWEQGILSREMLNDKAKQRTDLENAAVLITDLKIEEPRQLFPALELALRADIPALLIVAEGLSDQAIAFLLGNKQPDRFQAIAVKTPGWSKEEKAAALEDLAVLTGGRAFIGAAGDTLSQIKLDDFGQARRAWATHRTFGVVGGKGDPRELRRHIATLRGAFENSADPNAKEKLRERVGKLMGGSATLWIGGTTEPEMEAREELAKRTAAAIRVAMMEGVVPGGGVALLACRPALAQRRQQSTDPDERAAYGILMRAVEEPLRTIVDNAGLEPGKVVAEIEQAGRGHGFDVTSERVVGMTEAGIYDATAVQKSAVFAAISSAALALTIDVLVHHKQPERAPNPSRSVRKRL
ncbi:MAG: 60 kDa chaperonin [Anaerolineales bacterium]|nr:60 kDa chaperonin [Anaerolineales bacterium]